MFLVKKLASISGYPFSSVEELKNLAMDLTNAFDAVTELSQSEVLEDYNLHVIPFKKKDLLCKACKYGALLIIKMYTNHVPPSVIKNVAIHLCATIITTKRVCKGLVDLNVVSKFDNLLLFILKAHIYKKEIN